MFTLRGEWCINKHLANEIWYLLVAGRCCRSLLSKQFCEATQFDVHALSAWIGGGLDPLPANAKGISEQRLPVWDQLSKAEGGRHYQEGRLLWPDGISQKVMGSNQTGGKDFSLKIFVKVHLLQPGLTHLCTKLNVKYTIFCHHL